jgi:hypothetical protein
LVFERRRTYCHCPHLTFFCQKSKYQDVAISVKV